MIDSGALVSDIRLPRKLPITVAMVVHHGEATIERALKSVAGLVDEIVVSHNGPCRDRSVEIARRYTDKVYVQEEFIGAPEAYRVFVYQQATHEWIFQVDADEFLSQDLQQHLEELITDPTVDGYEFRWPTWYKGKYYRLYSRLCLFRKQCFYLIGSPSEHLKPIHKGIRIKHVHYVMEHKPPYDNLTLMTVRRKWLPWAKIQAEYYLKDFRSIPTYNYARSGWDWPTTIRLKHPFLLGMVGMTLYSVLLGIRDFARTGRWLFFKSGIYLGLFQFFIYYYVLSGRKR